MTDKPWEGTKITREHIQVHTITEYEHYPEHGARTETKEFRNSKHELETVEHIPCYMCHTMLHRESHHIFERSEWNGLDIRLVSFFLFNHYDYHGHVHRDFKSAEELHDWFMTHFNGKIVPVKIKNPDGTEVDDVMHVCDDVAADTIYNQWILCANDHRGMSKGAHGTTGPMFTARLARHAGFDPTLTKAEADATADATSV